MKLRQIKAAELQEGDWLLVTDDDIALVSTTDAHDGRIDVWAGAHYATSYMSSEPVYIIDGLAQALEEVKQ